ncbi:MAG: hypothetical protein COV37_16385 [Bdellovibrio sp. CG11_big_fil_rev_8_21_14_0_20_39_38]|nr:MAG: hypothetical protein COV37_16385 [Bdellovibrio sp. CG11_big_fil_rev_8_21_14_0_20_39_38]
MKKIIFSVALVSLIFSACDKQSNIEKVDAAKNNVERSAQKTFNRMDEKVCSDSDAECLAEKAKHRIEEGADYVGDKTQEAVDKVDN